MDSLNIIRNILNIRRLWLGSLSPGKISHSSISRLLFKSYEQNKIRVNYPDEGQEREFQQFEISEVKVIISYTCMFGKKTKICSYFEEKVLRKNCISKGKKTIFGT